MKHKHILSALFAAAAYASHVAVAQESVIVTPPLVISSDAESAASLSNDNIRLSYARCGDGGKALGCRMEVKVDGRWLPFLSSVEDNKVFVITGPEKLKRPNYKQYYPAWASGDTLSMNPFASGSVCEAVPVNARNIDLSLIHI